MRTDETSIVVGSRIESDGYYATVKFVGDVPETKGKHFKDLALISINLGTIH